SLPVQRLPLTGPFPPLDVWTLAAILPGVDGFAVSDAMRQAGNFTPVLMLTAKSLAEDLVHGLEAGADDYLAKPFDLAVLLARIHGLLRRRDCERGVHGGPVAERVGGAGAE